MPLPLKKKKKKVTLISVKFKEIPLMENYSSSKIWGRNETSDWQINEYTFSGMAAIPKTWLHNIIVCFKVF